MSRGPLVSWNQVSSHTEHLVMANLAQKDGIYLIRFPFRGKEFKRSLKTQDASAAAAACHVVELTIHRLHTGQIHVPDDVDSGDFIVSGGSLIKPVEPPAPKVVRPSTR